ncbi:GTP pyrophosphokinase [Dehalobacter sp. 12DCB1]|nr:GTP pyrophosphokinase [Dehalobacter sp. 14DCB1]TCX55635.1 GTP pyrophosphokinase [Dehalobacter sp. 12DCB1]
MPNLTRSLKPERDARLRTIADPIRSAFYLNAGAERKAMPHIDVSKTRYLFDGITGDLIPNEIAQAIRSFLAVENTYLSVAREIATRLENLNDALKVTMDRNPIQQIKTRVKTPKSIMDKLLRKDHEISVESAKEHLDDIAGIRVVCSYIDDIYLIANLLTAQSDIELIRRSDYIQNPKPNGYRSLHLVVTVPIFLSNTTERVKAEIQIRTIAMDYWATLEHEMVYKMGDKKTDAIVKELKDNADVIAQTDVRMQKLHDMVSSPPKLIPL